MPWHRSPASPSGLSRRAHLRKNRARAARSLRAIASNPQAASESPSSDGGSEYDGGVRRGDFAITTRLIAAQATSTQDRRLGGAWVPRFGSATSASYKTALHQQWAKDWSAAMSGAGLRRQAGLGIEVRGQAGQGGPRTSRPSQPVGRASASTFHTQLSRRQSTRLSRLRTGVCNLGAYRADVDPEKSTCKCGGVESRKHYHLLCPLYAAPRAALLSELCKLTLPAVSFLLGDPSATKAVL